MQAETRPAGRRRTFLALAGAGALVAGGAALAVRYPRDGQTLPEGERRQLIEQAGLPLDFPIHPEARRLAQPAQGGIRYGIAESVPVVFDWQHRSLLRVGYDVFMADLADQDEYATHWLYFRAASGASGAIVIRAENGHVARGTEIKVLSRGDARLIAPTLPADLLPPILRERR